MVIYSLLVNALLQGVAEDSQFSEWQRKGAIPRQSLEQMIASYATKLNSQNLPGRFRTSAILMTQYIYKSWFACQKQRQHRLRGKKRWLQVVECDSELAKISTFTPEAIRAKAQVILHHLSFERKLTGKHLLGGLLDAFDATTDVLSRRAIIHLLKNKLTVSEQDESLEDWNQRLESKRIEIERLEEQLQSQLPRGRDPTGERFIDGLLTATAFPQHNNPDQIEAEFDEWREQKQIQLFNSLPYPIIFGSADDLNWSTEKTGLATEQVLAKSPKRKKKKAKQPTERVCVRFKGFKDHLFKIQCDRRQLHIFRQFLQDYQLHFRSPDTERFSQCLFALRSARLIWQEDDQSHHKKGKVTHDLAPQERSPWETHRLYLHCNIDMRLLTAEGTGQVCQEEKWKTLKNLKGLDQLTESQWEEQGLTQNQQIHIKRQRSTLARLDNSAPQRPSVVSCQGNPLITVGISLHPQAPLTACVIDLKTGAILKCQTTKQLLRNPKIKSKHCHRSFLQLRLRQWRLVNKLHQRRQRRLLQQKQEQQQDRYRESQTESNLGLYVEHLIASRLVHLARQYQAGSIAVPDLKHIREILESDIQARARQKFPYQIEVQQQYAKQFRRSLHRWSYSRLVQCIRERAEREGILVITGQQPSQSPPEQKAKEVAISAHKQPL
jgi:IS605 OrfB family transposase